MHRLSFISLLLPVVIAIAACTDTVQGSGGGDDGGAGFDVRLADDAGAAIDAAIDAGGAGDDAGVEADGGHDPDTGYTDDIGIPDIGVTCAQGVAPAPGLVVTRSGPVRGTLNGGAYAWLGIPYAEPPTDRLRWRPPQLRGCWGGILQADTYGEKCAQVDNEGTYSGGEDCLTLNVWTPADYAQGKSHPVMVFIHGGGHIQGSSSEEAADKSHAFDGENLAVAAGVVVVTFNYRLGAFGFLAHEAFAAEDPTGAAGNYGILDQVAALGWVLDNARGFGGDPDRVMIFGESAGAVDVCMLLVSPKSGGLFHAAAMQSGTCMARPLAAARAFGGSYAKAAECAGSPDVATCLRALDAERAATVSTEQLTLAESWNSFHPSVDGRVIPSRPLDMLRKGTYHRVPVIVGSNADETDLAVDPFMLESDYKGLVLALAGGDQPLADRMLSQYPIKDYLFVARSAYVRLTTDRKFTCPARRAARLLAAPGAEGAYRYFFTHPFQNNPLYTSNGAFHGIELNYLFDRLRSLTYIPSAGEKIIRDRMISYWGSLAATGDPNDGYIQKWPSYTAADPYVQFEDPIEILKGVRTATCDFWDAIDGTGDEY